MAPLAVELTISFPGIERIESLVANDRHGISPSVMLLNVLPQASLPSVIGDLVIGSGQNVRIWRDCLIDSGTAAYDANGLVATLALLDRRWRWRFGTISGQYNVRDKTGEIIASEGENANNNPYANTEKTPRELCAILLDAMGEVNYDIQDVPNSIRPEVDWYNDNPANELANLCDILGCGIVLQPDNRVAIRVLGVGSEFPFGAVISDAPTLDPPEIPTRISVITEPIQYQWDFELEAVGVDRDESIKRIDDLDIKPLTGEDGAVFAGWSDFDAHNGFAGMLEEDRKLAEIAVYKWYAIKFPFSYPDRTLPNGGEFKFKEEIVLLDRQVDKRFTLDKSGFDQKDPFVYGIWYDEDEGTQEPGFNPAKVTSKSKGVVPYSFFLDTERQIVKFSYPVYAYSDGNLRGPGLDADLTIPAILRLRTGFLYRNVNRSLRALQRDQDTGARLNTRPYVVRRHDLFPSQWIDFENATTFSQGIVRHNFETIYPRLDPYMDTIQESFRPKTSGVKVYIGIVPVRLDGALLQATYQMNSVGVTTTVQRNQDLGSQSSTPAALMRQYERTRLIDNLRIQWRAKQQKLSLEREAGS